MGAVSLADLYIWSVRLVVFLCVVLLVTGIVPAVVNRARVRRRLELPAVPAQRVEGIGSALVAALQRRGVSLEDTKGESLRGRLCAAGYDQPQAQALYTLLRIFLSFGLPGLFLVLNFTVLGISSAANIYIAAAVSALLGLYLPQLWLRARAARRRREMLNGLPDTLDLMLVCVEAGLGIDAAFHRIGPEISEAHPLLARELACVTLELRAGRSREEALRRMAERSGVNEIRSFVMLLTQSEKLGTSIAQALRTYAAEMRERRKLQAEEKAHRLPVLLSVPLVACLLPTMVGVLMLPSAIRVMRDLLPALAR